MLWEHGELAARDVYARLPADAGGTPARGWAYRTVKTLLSRLVAKDAIAYQQVGNSYLYRAAVAREAMTQQVVDGVLDRVIGGVAGQRVLSSLIARFVGDAELSPEEIDRLQALLDAKRAEHDGSSSEKQLPRSKRGRQS